ncbi:hypothetical protein FAZ79_11220 [Guyparkeria sp. SB14A]|nr:hypothetical protein FAZ79_11220 [Guyparkeria sp. SB14A]
MKTMLMVFTAGMLSMGLGNVAVAGTSVPTYKGAEVLEHGGGCRKSSPPGQCCHMENSTGIVHCH